MDFAYDQIQKESLPSDQSTTTSSTSNTTTTTTTTGLPTDLQEAFKAVQSSPWGARLGGFFTQAKKQTETLYSDAQKEYASRSEQAAKLNTSFSDPTFALPDQVQAKGTAGELLPDQKDVQRPDSLPADIVKEASSMVSRLRLTAAAKLNLKKIQAAEDAADEALLKFGTNIRSFLRDAVTVTAPSNTSSTSNTELLFETNDAQGKRVIHSSRFDAQLHVIHTSPQSFTTDPDASEYTDNFVRSFDISAKTEDIAADLEKYPELRRAMEKLVPQSVEYSVFWTRYYFLRRVIQEEEVKRKEVLKGAAQEADENIAWGSDDDSDDEQQQEKEEEETIKTLTPTTPLKSSTTTKTPQHSQTNRDPSSHSEDLKSVSSSSDDTSSYDIVSGTASRAPASPRDDTVAAAAAVAATSTVGEKIKEESDEDEEDWE